ncbi:phosphopyruvate hydratase [Patescibacteria group bacterium]|nr:phosphopyruvate hydratase [Patescibacteria group bacterium]MBU1867913.1 phosphopyruvate hydratase [Patescibacteria group bacterium]
MALIRKINARQILNSRGLPTVEAVVLLENDQQFTASCPTGISRGTREAIELTDKDFARFRGREVNTAIRKINEIIFPVLRGTNPIEQGLIDRKIIDLDGTPNLANLGVNAVLPVSTAVAKAGASVAKQHFFAYLNHYFNELIVELDDYKIDTTEYKHHIPRPAFVLIEGGQHTESNQPFQEFLLIPKVSDNQSFWEQLRIGSETFYNLKDILIERGLPCSYGEEGGFSSPVNTPEEALDLILSAAEKTGFTPYTDFTLGIDAAGAKPSDSLSSHEEIINYYTALKDKYPIELIEDPFPEQDWASWIDFVEMAPEGALIVGDDFTVTNPELVEQAISRSAISGLIIKPNQVGTITDTLRVAKIANYREVKTVVSHRGGDTNDNFIADLAVGVSANFIKCGLTRGERVAKYNRLLEIDAIIGQAS